MMHPGSLKLLRVLSKITLYLCTMPLSHLRLGLASYSSFTAARNRRLFFCQVMNSHGRLF